MRKRVLISSIFFLLGIPSVVLYLKFAFIPNALRNSATLLPAAKNSTDTTIYFVGSSRVSWGINDSLLSSKVGKPVQILGYAGATFLCNSLLVHHLVKQKGHKVIFVELSSLLPDVPTDFRMFMKINRFSITEGMNGLVQCDNIWQRRRFYLDAVNNGLMENITLNTDLQYLLTVKNPRLIGFQPRIENKYKQTNTILRKEELNNTSLAGIDTMQYMNFARHIIGLASSNDCQLYFFTPVIFRNPNEKKLSLGIWNMLPENLRLEYSDTLWNKIGNSAYLYDNFHFNVTGANVYTAALAPSVDSLINMR